MFRKLYKEANDEIKIDEQLIEKTLKAANSPRKTVFRPTAFYSAAAAILLLIGVTTALPFMMNTSDTEQSIVYKNVEKEEFPTETHQVQIDTFEEAEPTAPTLPTETVEKPKQTEYPTVKPTEKPKKAVKVNNAKPKSTTAPTEHSNGSVPTENKLSPTEQISVAAPAAVTEAETSVSDSESLVQSYNLENNNDLVKVASGGAGAKTGAAESDKKNVSTREYSDSLGIDLNGILSIPVGFKETTPEYQNGEVGYFCYSNDDKNVFINVYTSKKNSDEPITYKEEDGSVSADFTSGNVHYTVEAFGMTLDELKEILKY